VVPAVTVLAQLLADLWSQLQGPRSVTLKTPKGSLTMDSDASSTTEAILHQIRESGVI
jgi:hypothetical protein